MTTEHQPGSPGAVDLDALDAAYADIPEYLEHLQSEVIDVVAAYRPMAAELRTLRARVGELEAAILRGNDRLEQTERDLYLRLQEAEARAESAEARVKELECAEAELNLENGRLRDRLDTILTITRRGKRITDLESQLTAARSNSAQLSEELRAVGEELAAVREELAVRPVVSWFAQEMERVLQANDHKGGWDTSDIGYLKDRLREECVELEMALDAKPDSEAQREAVDVANFAMMIADSLREGE